MPTHFDEKNEWSEEVIFLNAVKLDISCQAKEFR